MPMEKGDAKKVLIVDDDLHMRFFLKTLLETNGFIPITAREGAEGIQKATDSRPDLIILDIMMPGEGGVAMYRHLKSDELLSDIPVIMLSGVDYETFRHSLHMINITLEKPLPEPAGYLEKPPEAGPLLKLIEAVLKREEEEK